MNPRPLTKLFQCRKKYSQPEISKRGKESTYTSDHNSVELPCLTQMVHSKSSMLCPGFHSQQNCCQVWRNDTKTSMKFTTKQRAYNKSLSKKMVPFSVLCIQINNYNKINDTTLQTLMNVTTKQRAYKIERYQIRLCLFKFCDFREIAAEL